MNSASNSLGSDPLPCGLLHSGVRSVNPFLSDFEIPFKVSVLLLLD